MTAGSDLSPRQLNRATLARQMLLRRERVSAVDAVRRLLAVQAQEAASPYLALWNRVARFDPAELDAAFAERTVVKASLLRITLHAVHVDDYPAIHHAMSPSLRASRLHDPRFKVSGLSIADADSMLPHLTELTATPRTVAEIERALEAQLGERKEGLWWALRTFAPLHHAPTPGPWSFGTRSSFVAAGDAQRPATHDEAVQHLLLRYLHAFGPASAADFAQFTILRRPVVQQALRSLAGRLVELEGPDGAALFDVPGATVPTATTAAPPRLLPMWDSVLLAYADRSRIIPPEHRPVVIRRNGDVLATLLVDGYVAGVWRPVEGGIEATAFHELDEVTWKGLAAEAKALVAFLAGRDPAVYSRAAHWWAKGIPSAEVRVLPG